MKKLSLIIITSSLISSFCPSFAMNTLEKSLFKPIIKSAFKPCEPGTAMVIPSPHFWMEQFKPQNDFYDLSETEIQSPIEVSKSEKSITPMFEKEQSLSDVYKRAWYADFRSMIHYLAYKYVNNIPDGHVDIKKYIGGKLSFKFGDGNITKLVNTSNLKDLIFECITLDMPINSENWLRKSRVNWNLFWNTTEIVNGKCVKMSELIPIITSFIHEMFEHHSYGNHISLGDSTRDLMNKYIADCLNHKIVYKTK